ncbi:hypothetical protein [Methylocella tundrae]|uniref:hypothetical protein n=1 Tax=Methylocella tundrae TaxID=227605 RepID=UPI00157A75BD|nr:hypothetical protein [Methylocella tundrae]
MNSRLYLRFCIPHLRRHETPKLGVHETGSRPKPITPKTGSLFHAYSHAVLPFGAGYRTYIIAAVLVLVVVVEKGLGIDVPGVDVGSDWLTQILAALGLGTLRAGITGANK